MPAFKVEQTTFETGEVGAEHLFRGDLAARSKSVKRARNVRILVSGAVEARPGTARMATLDGDGIAVMMVVQDTAFVLVLTDQKLEVWDKASRTLVDTVTGCAWTTAMIEDDATPLNVAPYDKTARVFHPTLPTQVITRETDGQWSVAADTPADGIGGALRQAYYRYADRGVSLTPNGRTGSINLTASTAYFDALHDELRFRVQGREVQVTSITNSTVAAATVVQELYPTVTLAVESSNGFEVGEIVQGRDTQAEGEVTGIPSGTSLTLLMQTFTKFFYDAAATPTGEQVIGRNATTRVTAAQTNTTNAACLDFDEQAESLLRGYAATGAVHGNRLWKGRLPGVPFGVLASAIGDFQDFEAGTGDADAIFEELGNANAGVVRHILSAEQLLIGTARGIFYYPESEANPIRPTSFGVNQVGPDGVSPCKPVLLSEGAMFVENGGGSIIGVFPTGDVRRSWKTADVSLLSNHLILSPRSLAYVSGGETDPERYVYGANSDGSMPVVFYSDAAEIFGWTQWETAGECRSLCAYQGEAWGVFRRDHGGTDVYSLEVFDPARYMDACLDVEEADLQGPATDEMIEGPDGAIAAANIYRCADLAEATCSLMVGDAYIGEVELNADGDFGVPDLEGDIVLGFNFTPEVETWHPINPDDNRSHRRKTRIVRATARWAGRYMAINDDLLPTYRGGEDTGAAPPLRDEEVGVPDFGWAYEPTARFTRPYPGPWRLYGCVLEARN